MSTLLLIHVADCVSAVKVQGSDAVCDICMNLFFINIIHQIILGFSLLLEPFSGNLCMVWMQNCSRFGWSLCQTGLLCHDPT